MSAQAKYEAIYRMFDNTDKLRKLLNQVPRGTYEQTVADGETGTYGVPEWRLGQ